MEAEVKMLENEIKQACLVDKPRMARQGVYDHTYKFENYCHELISLMPWLGPHIAKYSDQGSALQMVKCTMPTIIRKAGYFLGNMMDVRMKLYTGGETT